MTKVYWTMNEIMNDHSLTRGWRDALVSTMTNTGGPVELTEGHCVHPYQPAQITKARTMGMHFASDLEEAAITRALGEDVIEGEVVEDVPQPVYQPVNRPRPQSHVHGVLRNMVGESAIAQAYASAKRIERLEAMERAARTMTTEQKRRLVRGGR